MIFCNCVNQLNQAVTTTVQFIQIRNLHICVNCTSLLIATFFSTLVKLMFENNVLVLLYMLFIRGRKLYQLLGNQDTMGSPNTWFTRSRNSVKRSVTLVDRRRSEL